MIRLVLLGLVLFLGIYGITQLIALSGKKRNACPNCGGKGYWYGLREREQCRRCNGTGVMGDG